MDRIKDRTDSTRREGKPQSHLRSYRNGVASKDGIVVGLEAKTAQVADSGILG